VTGNVVIPAKACPREIVGGRYPEHKEQIAHGSRLVADSAWLNGNVFKTPLVLSLSKPVLSLSKPVLSLSKPVLSLSKGGDEPQVIRKVARSWFDRLTTNGQ